MYIGKNGFKVLDCNLAGRDFIVSDLHGCYQQLMDKLAEIDFDFDRDRLICVGDLIDRGPDPLLCLTLLNDSWFYTVLGNHEIMMLHDDPIWIPNGGDWALEVEFDTLDFFREKIETLPYAIELTRKDGKRVGIVHAEPEDDWNNVYNWTKDKVIWCRNKIGQKNIQPVKNIDLVVCGHTPLIEPVLKANIYWIDTGAFVGEWAKNNESYKDMNGRLTLINVEDLPI